MMKPLFFTVLVSINLAYVLAQTSGLVPKTYLNLPLGEILPSGWLHDQLSVQVNGLAGHEHDFYDYVSNSDWIGGTSYYSNLEEAGSYWFNGLVPTGVLMNDSTIKAQTQQFLDYVLDHQDSTGWLGPEVGTTKPRYLWARYPFFFGAIQMMEADPSLTERVVPAMQKFVSLANAMLKNGTGVEDWTATRWADMVMTLQWLYDYHPNGTEALLLETMQLVKDAGDPWASVFEPAIFPTGPVEDLTNPNSVLTWHGVNMAEGLKALPASYRFTHNKTELDVISKGWDLLFQYHGRPSGIYAADEYLAGLEAHRGTELCLVVETMFSGSYLFQVIGDLKYVDRVERITYNALPATLTGNMWSRQYLQQQNQIAAKNMTNNPFPIDGPYSNVFGLEPNYPCCTVNHPQGWPKFISNAFVMTPDNTQLVHVYLGPFSTSTTLANNNKVTVNVDTLYPFSDSLTTTITATKQFKYSVRIPSWIKPGAGSFSINGGSAQAITKTGALMAFSIKPGTTKISLHLPADITIESRPHGSVAVHRGPLHYAFQITHNQTVLAQNAQESQAVDLEFDATVPWSYAIDPTKLTFHGEQVTSLPSPIFQESTPPFTITAVACPIDWGLGGLTYSALPPTGPNCTGSPTNITLYPFGATKLRIGEFPTFTAN